MCPDQRHRWFWNRETLNRQLPWCLLCKSSHHFPTQHQANNEQGTDPGVKISIYYPVVTNYIIPGPRPMTCSGGGGNTNRKSRCPGQHFSLFPQSNMSSQPLPSLLHPPPFARPPLPLRLPRPPALLALAVPLSGHNAAERTTLVSRAVCLLTHALSSTSTTTSARK